MDMESKNFLKSKLGELHSKFPNLSIKYQYDAYTQNHIVEIIPLDEFEKNEDYIAFESDLCFEPELFILSSFWRLKVIF